MPISATFTSCCGLNTPRSMVTRRHPAHHRGHTTTTPAHHQFYTIMSPPTTALHRVTSFTSSSAAVSGSFTTCATNGSTSAASASSTTRTATTTSSCHHRFLLPPQPQEAGLVAVSDDHELSLVLEHRHQNYINHSSSSFGSASLASFVSSSRATSPVLAATTPHRSTQRLVLLPVAASSPSAKFETTTPKMAMATANIVVGNQQQQQNDSLMTTLMMHVYESSPYKKPAHHHQSPQQQLLSASRNYYTNEENNKAAEQCRRQFAASRLAQSSLDLNNLRPSVMTTPIGNPLMMLQQHQERLEEPQVEPSKKAKSSSLWNSWSKRLVQALHVGSRNSADISPTSQPADHGKKSRKERQYYGTASKATVPPQDNGAIYSNTPLRTAVSVSNCRMGVMDTIPELIEQRCSVVPNEVAFMPLSPESHVLPQSPYHKADPNQMRSFFKSKSAAAFRELPHMALTPTSNPSSNASSTSMSPMRLNGVKMTPDPIAYLTPANQQFTSPSGPALIMRDWSSCALAAAAAAKRRPNQPQVTPQQPTCPPQLSGTNTLPANFHMVNQQPSSSLIALIRAYNVPNAANVASRFVQLANIASVEQMAELALYQQNQIPRIIRRISPNAQEQQRLCDMLYDLANIAGGAFRLQQQQFLQQQQQIQLQHMMKPTEINSTKNVTNSSTDSGVYGSDGDAPVSLTEEPTLNQHSALRDFLARAQIDLASMPYSDKFGFGQIQPDWVVGLAEVIKCEPIATATALDSLRRDTLRKCGKIYIPQKDLPEKVRIFQQQSRRCPSIEHRSLQRRHQVVPQQEQQLIQNGSASLNRNFKQQNTVSQPLLPSMQAAVSSRNVSDMLCDCRSPDCVRL